MGEANPKKDLSLIIQLTYKLGYESDNYAQPLAYANKSEDFNSAYGLRYKNRLSQLCKNACEDDSCVICNSHSAENKIVCKSCFDRFTALLNLTKQEAAKKPQSSSEAHAMSNADSQTAKAASDTTSTETVSQPSETNTPAPVESLQSSEISEPQAAEIAAQAASAAAKFTNKQMHKFAKKVNELAGGEGEVELKFRDLFVNVFKHHSRDEAEEIFICGTKYTTPDADKISTSWPKPWLYSRIAIMLFAAFYLLLLCWTGFKNSNVLPDIIFIGSLIMPITILVFYFEINAPRNISIFTTLSMFFVGGCASLLITLMLFDIFPVGELDFAGAAMVGAIEELGKLAITVFFIKRSKCKYILNGLLIGGAIGAGFAAFESAGYAFRFFLMHMRASADMAYDAMMHVIYTRALLAPGGHVAWAAMAGAAIMIVLAGKDFSFDALKSKRFLSLFALAVAMHAVWDMPIGKLLGTSLPIVQLTLTALAWIVIIVFLTLGLKQVNNISSAN